MQKLLGLTSLTLWVLTAYFALWGAQVEDQAYAPAETALASALKILAGACAIPALVTGGVFLTTRDEEIMTAQAGDRAES